MTCDDCGSVRHWKRHRPERSGLCRSCAALRRGQQDERIGCGIAASWQEIADELGVSRQRVMDLYESAMRKLARWDLCHGRQLRALLVDMKEQEPAELGGRQTRRGR